MNQTVWSNRRAFFLLMMVSIASSTLVSAAEQPPQIEWNVTFDSGDSVVVHHPESMALSPSVIVILRPSGDVIESEPRKVTFVERLRSSNGARKRPSG